MIIRMYVAYGSTSCYNEMVNTISSTEVDVNCNHRKGAKPTVELRCIVGSAKGIRKDIAEPFWDCAHYQDKELDKNRREAIMTGDYSLIDRTECKTRPLPQNACVTTTAPCQYEDPESVKVPEHPLQMYQVRKDLEEKVYATPIVGGDRETRNIKLEPNKWIQLISSDDEKCIILYQGQGESGPVKAEMNTWKNRIEPMAS